VHSSIEFCTISYNWNRILNSLTIRQELQCSPASDCRPECRLKQGRRHEFERGAGGQFIGICGVNIVKTLKFEYGGGA